MAKLATTYRTINHQPESGWDPAAFQKESDELSALMDAGLETPDEDVVGFVMRFPVADGYAFYVVTKAKPLTIEWVQIGDSWQVPEYTLRGLRLGDIVDMKRRSRAMRALFSKKVEV